MWSIRKTMAIFHWYKPWIYNIWPIWYETHTIIPWIEVIQFYQRGHWKRRCSCETKKVRFIFWFRFKFSLLRFLWPPKIRPKFHFWLFVTIFISKLTQKHKLEHFWYKNPILPKTVIGYFRTKLYRERYSVKVWK